MNNTHFSHKLFFQAITENKLNELLKRADNNTGILQRDINNILEPYTCIVKLNRKFNKKYCDIIITYFNNSTEIGHTTLHLKSDNTKLNNSIRKSGRLHIRNYNKTCYPFNCTKKQIEGKNNSINISMTQPKFIRSPLKICLDATLNILNKYFDFNSELSLDKRLTNYPEKCHPCLNPILSNFSRITIKAIKKTRKNPSKY